MNKMEGITGMNGSGKGTAVEMLVQRGFLHYSASDFILEEVIRLNMPQNRDSLILVGNELRSQFGPGYIASELVKRAKLDGGMTIIESIRTLGEVEILKNEGGMLLAVDADQKLRYERIVKRGGIKDKVSWEKFVEQENLESKSDDPNKPNLTACRKKADYVIDNNGTLADLEAQVDDFLRKIN